MPRTTGKAQDDAVTVPRIPRVAVERAPPGTRILRVERMSRAFTKYHLDDGRALHRFRMGEPHADPHDHPWSFETEILAGGYVEEVFHHAPHGGWHSELVHRTPGTVHQVQAEHIHRIIELPERECWTVVRAGLNARETRFWRFGADVRSRAWHQRRWLVHG